ncbi:MAG TPA: LysR family transcriptional regulator [Kofleriaceae bacterium]|nr:LysR family transcriptional regulator [Kofleriaceae bacterium]
MTLNYNHLHYFHVAATEGSVAATATRLGVTQPTVSEQIRALERTLGVTLFERSTTGLRLTDAGKLAYEHTVVIFATGDRLVAALGQQHVDGPELRVGVSVGVARSWSARVLAPLFTLPGCALSVRTGDPADLLRALRAGELEVMLTAVAPPASETSGLMVAEVARSSVVAIGVPTGEGPGAWQQRRIARLRSVSSARWAVDSFLEQQGAGSAAIDEADDALLLIEAAARGDVVALLPRSAAREALDSGRVSLLATLETGDAVICALYRDGAAAEMARRAVALVSTHGQDEAPP